MPIDPLVALAFSVQSNKAVYALLLGSGVSRSAGIPTGWEVVLDLIRKLAGVQKEKPEPTPEQWFRGKHGEEPNYAALLNALTRTAAERTQLLRSYFEPTEEERSQGLKSPTVAHRAIAELMRLGYFRVVLTTNFDRLLEQAIRDAGLEPTVISTADAIKGAVPLAHAQCTIIKLHGDYLDHRLKNTPTELATYEKPMDSLLDRVLDEFGLIVCGWSGQYDTALKAAIERCPNRRYPMYWAGHDTVGDVATRLINLRAGTKITIRGADEFFANLRDSVVALESLQDGDPLSEKIAVARTKKYVSKPEYRIDFHDLLHRETERVIERICGPEFPVQGVQFSPELLERRLASYESSCGVLLSMAAASAYWASEEHYSVILSCLRRLVEDPLPSNGLTIFINLRRYPALLFLYVTCLSAIGGNKYDLVARIFEERVKPERHRESGQLIALFHQYKVLEHGAQKFLPGRERQFTPLSNRLFECLRPMLHEYLLGDLAYEGTFDWFEYLAGLIHCHRTADWITLEKAKTEGRDPKAWGPIGCFGWRHREDSEWLLTELQIKDGVLPERLGRVREAFFQGNNPGALARFLLAKEAFDNFVVSVVSGWN